jgi:general secretion pathway protein K
MKIFSILKTHGNRAKQKGMALMLAVFTVVLASYIAVEVSYESNVEYLVNAQAVSKIKAYYAARSGVELSLFRIKLYQVAQNQYGKQMGSNAKMLDLIWSFPMAWPPVAPPGATQVDKDLMKSMVKESKMDAAYMATISEEGSKLDINDLASPSKTIRDTTRKRLLQIFEIKFKNEEAFRIKYQDTKKFEDLVNRIIDWVSPGSKSVSGGAKSQYYEATEDTGPLPPNRAFRTLDELRLVAGMTEDLFNILESQITIYGLKSINPNYAPPDVLKSLDSSMTDEIVQEIIKRRESNNPGLGPFVNDPKGSCADEFWTFVNNKGARIGQETQKSTPISCDSVSNFRISSTGMYNNVSRQITVVVYDTAKAVSKVADAIRKDRPQVDSNGNPIDPNSSGGAGSTSSGSGPSSQSGSAGQSNSPSKGVPRIVYWKED